MGPVYAPRGVPRFKKLLEREQPDVVHLHNVYPLISPQVVRAAHAQGVPVVQTLHNYRHSCVNGLQFRNGGVCTDCDGTKLSLPAVRHGCYRGSRAQTVPMAIGRAVHRSTWTEVDRFLALTPFMAERLALTGVPASRITVRPSWVPDPGAPMQPGDDVVCIGRLDEAKGTALLLAAWAQVQTDRRLIFAGDGPMLDQVRAAAAADPSIVYVGSLDRAGVAAAMQRAAVVVVPSVCFEGFPLTVVEAFSQGRPVIVLNGGSAASVVDDTVGWRVEPSALALGSALEALDPLEAAVRGAAARLRYSERYSGAAAGESLLATYNAVTNRPSVKVE